MLPENDEQEQIELDLKRHIDGLRKTVDEESSALAEKLMQEIPADVNRRLAERFKQAAKNRTIDIAENILEKLARGEIPDFEDVVPTPADVLKEAAILTVEAEAERVKISQALLNEIAAEINEAQAIVEQRFTDPLPRDQLRVFQEACDRVGLEIRLDDLRHDLQALKMAQGLTDDAQRIKDVEAQGVSIFLEPPKIGTIPAEADIALAIEETLHQIEELETALDNFVCPVVPASPPVFPPPLPPQPEEPQPVSIAAVSISTPITENEGGVVVQAFADGGVVGGASGLQATLSGAASVLGKVGDPRAAATAQGIGAAAGILGAFGGSGGGQDGSGLGGGLLGSFGVLGGSLFGTDKNGAPRTLESLLEERVPFFSEFLDVQESLNESFFGQEEAHQEALTEEQDLQNKTRSQWMEFSSSAIAKSMGAAQNIASALMQSGSKKMFAVGKSIAIAQAVLDTAQGAIGAYAAFSWIPFVGPALGAAAAAEAIKMGKQRIKQIQGQQFGTAANVSPGDTPSFPTAEDVKKLQGGMPTLGGARSDAQTLSITIASDRRVLPEEWVRDHLIPGINETIRDGATLNISFD